MASSYTTSLRLTLPVQGELPASWGNTVNTGVTDLVDAAVAGTAAVTLSSTTYTLTSTNGASDEARRMFITFTGTPGGAATVTCPAVSKLYVVTNNTTGGFAVTLKTAAGSGIAVPNGKRMMLYCNATDVIDAATYASSLSTANVSYTGTLTGGTGVVAIGTNQIYKDASGNVGFGLTTPSAPIHVSGSTVATTTAKLENTGSGSVAAARLTFQRTSTAARSLTSLAGTIFFNDIDTSGGTFGSSIYGGFGTNTAGATVQRLVLDGHTSILFYISSSQRGAISADGFNFSGALSASLAPVSVNASTYTVLANDLTLRFTTTNCTVTLPVAASYTGRFLYISNITANSVTSAASNVVPLGSATAGTAILAATAGKFAMLQSNGSNWLTLMAN